MRDDRAQISIGNQVTGSGVTIWQVRDGKILTAWIDQNMAGLIQQLGGNAETVLGTRLLPLTYQLVVVHRVIERQPQLTRAREDR